MDDFSSVFVAVLIVTVLWLAIFLTAFIKLRKIEERFNDLLDQIK
jgi:hypothetical protein